MENIQHAGAEKGSKDGGIRIDREVDVWSIFMKSGRVSRICGYPEL